MCMIRMIQRVEYKIQTKYKGYRLLAKDLRHKMSASRMEQWRLHVESMWTAHKR